MEEKGRRVFIEHSKNRPSNLYNKVGVRIDEEPIGIISGLCATKRSIESIQKLRNNNK